MEKLGLTPGQGLASIFSGFSRRATRILIREEKAMAGFSLLQAAGTITERILRMQSLYAPSPKVGRRAWGGTSCLAQGMQGCRSRDRVRDIWPGFLQADPI